MLSVEIRRPKTAEIKQLHDFLKTVITDTYIKDGIGDQIYDMNEEIEVKKKYIQMILKAMVKILSKTILLSNDTKIKDPHILEQIKG